MKRKLLLATIFSVLTLTSLAGCSKQQEEPKQDKEFVLERKLTNTTISLTKNELEQKLENKDDFLLLVSDATCQGCISFKNSTLKDFVQNTKIKVYEISIQELPSDNEIIKWKTTPTIGMFVDGELEEMISDRNEGNIFSSYQNFNSWVSEEKEGIKKFAELGIEITETKLDYFIENGEKMMLYFKRDTCGDCGFFKENFLNKEAKLSLDSPYYRTVFNQTEFYILDINQHYLDRDPELGANDPEWLEFTAKYGLSDEEHFGSNKGWKTGVVPTFQFRSNGSIVDSAVIYNDDMEFNENYSTLKITNSFYSDSPYINKTFEKTESKSAYKRYQEETLDFFTGKLEELFIEYRN